MLYGGKTGLVWARKRLLLCDSMVWSCSLTGLAMAGRISFATHYYSKICWADSLRRFPSIIKAGGGNLMHRLGG